MLSVIICTHNRSALLRYCLESFTRQTVGGNSFELIVVDNGSLDNTREVVLSYMENWGFIRYVVEPRLGLSHARNYGFKEARFDWVGYVDDDAKAYPDFIERCFGVIENYKFDCFGGRFLAWYLSPKPKWISRDFGTFPDLLGRIGELPPHQHVPGGVMVFKKSALLDVGGFPVNLGMMGNQVGYGEENWVQNELRKKSYVIGYDPDLKIDHLVAEYKYAVKWHLKRMYAKGKADRMLDEEQSAISLFILLVRSILSALYKVIRNLPRLFFNPDYHWQNYVIDSSGYVMKSIGYLISGK